MQIELTDLVDKIVGPYTAHGETIHDNEAKENLKEVEKLLYHVLEKLVHNAKNKNHCAWSIRDVGEKSYDILMECEEYIKEIKGNQND